MIENPPSIKCLTELQPGRHDLRFGGKALGLARLIQLGIPTRGGFAVSASVLPMVAWPKEVRRDFESRCLSLLSEGPIALRSSALGEDSEERSFAGLFETVLDVKSLTEALAAVDRCISSGARKGTLDYARTHEPIPVGLVVQRMVESHAAGVIFTRDPSGKDPALVLEVVRGRGDALVSGRESPDRWRVYRAGTGEIEMRSSPSESSEGSVLAPERVRDLALEAWRIARLWGDDLDLEWALDDSGVVSWLQARPITTGSKWQPPSVSSSRPSNAQGDDGPITVWANWNIRESIPAPMTPLTWSVWKDVMVPVLTRELLGVPESSSRFQQAFGLDLVEGRLYFNMNALLGSPGIGPVLPYLLQFVDSRAAQGTRKLLEQGVLRPRQIPGGALWRASCRVRTLIGLLGRLPKLSRPRRELEKLSSAGDRIQARPRAQEMSDSSLLHELRLLARAESRPLTDALMMANFGFFIWLLATRLFRPWPKACQLLAVGVEGNPTTLISVELDRLTALARPFRDSLLKVRQSRDILPSLREEARQGREEIKDWLRQFDAFLESYGHRAPAEIELSNPRWSEDPSMPLELIRVGLLDPPSETVKERMARLVQLRDREIQAALRAASFWRRPWMRWLSMAVLAYMPLREAPKHHTMRAAQRVREAALELGRRCTRRGLFKTPDDVFFLSIQELEELFSAEWPEAGPWLERVARRRQELESFKRKKAPDFIRSDGVPVDMADSAVSSFDDRLIARGVGIGGGEGQGPVVILEEPDPRQIKEGAVLVVKFADPAWTPLFSRVSAVIMEVGGSMCHAAVIARELGIPAVFGVKDAKERFKNGERVAVNGDEGWIKTLP